jgi:AAA family ATP:ADP antiporter
MNIVSRIYKSLNVLEDERAAISLLLIHSFFIGVFLSYYLAYANGVFLKVFKPEMLPYTYVLSGIAGFIASAIFSYFQKRVAYSRVIIGTLVVIFLLIVSFIVGIAIIGEADWLVFVMFVGLIPVFGLVAIQYGGMTMKLFDLRQGKRLFGIIASGEVISSIIWFFTIPIILPFLGQTWYLLVGSLIGLSLGLFFQWVIIGKFSKELSVKPKAEATLEVDVKKEKGSIAAVFKNRYFSLIFVLMILSTLGRVFTDYSFMGVARETFKDSLTAFFGVFFGLLKVIELLINTFIAGRLLSKYGVRLGLIILPFLMVIFAVFGVISYWMGAGAMVFLALAMNKLFDKTVRTSLESPSFKTLYQPLDEETKFKVQTQTEGNAGQMAVFIAGGLLILCNFIFPSFTIMQSTYLLCGILIVWLFVASKTVKEYRNVVVEKLYDYKSQAPTEVVQDSANMIIKGLEDTPEIQGKTVQFLTHYNPLSLFPFLSEMLKNDSEIIRNNALDIIIENKLYDYKSIFKEKATKNTAYQQSLADLESDFDHIEKLDETTILNYINSNNSEKHLLAIQGIHRLNHKNVGYLAEKLLYDTNEHVALATVDFVGKENNAPTLRSLVNHLSSDFLGRLSYYQLTQSKVNIVSKLNQAFSQYETDNRFDSNQKMPLIKILKILKENGSDDAKAILLNKISYSDYEIRQLAVQSLKALDFQSSEARLVVKQAIEATTQHCAWITATKLDITKAGKQNTSIWNTIEMELQVARNEIFDLLSFIYDQEAIAQIVTNLNTNLSEREVLAIEMSDILLEEDIKEIVFPIIDRISDSERLKQLNLTYPQMRLGYEERLKDIVNYSFSRISSWTKCVAIQTLHEELPNEVPIEIVANVYNSNQALREVAFVSIFEASEKSYYKYIEKENTANQIRLNRIVGLLPNDSMAKIAIEKAAVLGQLKGFSKLSKMLLLKIAEISQTIKIGKTAILKPNESLSKPIYMVIEGTLEETSLQGNTIYRSGQIIGLFEAIDFERSRIKVLKDSYLIAFEADQLFELIQVYDDLASVIFNFYIKNNVEEEEAVVEKNFATQHTTNSMNTAL